MPEIPAKLIAQASTTYDAVQMVGDTVMWIEGRPDGCDVLVSWTPDQGVRDLVPPGMSVASNVHEYGGGAYLATDKVAWFCNADDQRIYHLDAAGSKPITPEPPIRNGLRYADLRLSPDQTHLLAVQERHIAGGPVINELVRTAMDPSGPSEAIASEWDFYSFPRPSPDGTMLAWTCWNAPHMPWDATWLYVAPLDPDGRLGDPVHIAGGSEESIFQPEWSPDGTLHFVSDRSSWWNLYAWKDGHITPILIQQAELGVAQWEFGYSTYTFLDQHRIAVLAQNGGRQQLHVLHGGGELRTVPLPYTSIKPYLSGHGSNVALIASSPTSTPAVVLVDVDTGDVQRLAGTEIDLPTDKISIAEPFTLHTRDGQQAHGLYYPPTSPSAAGPPPLIVKAHPGPTSNFPQRLDWHTQVFTSRGYAVAEIDYRGSTGYGRAYRQALHNYWGTRDALDCTDAANHLARTAKADPNQMVIWGASAGGYTALRALALTNTFTAAIARSPIIRRTIASKFQADHTKSLVGPGPESSVIDQELSLPLNERLTSNPILIVHGENDPVAPVQASVVLANAIGPNVTLIIIPDAGHSLSGANTAKQSLDSELAFVGVIG